VFPMLRLRRRDLVCQQAVELVTDYLEGTLSRADRRRFDSPIVTRAAARGTYPEAPIGPPCPSTAGGTPERG
jgi:hypothetical protein